MVIVVPTNPTSSLLERAEQEAFSGRATCSFNCFREGGTCLNTPIARLPAFSQLYITWMMKKQ